jgi:hypothetical protein
MLTEAKKRYRSTEAEKAKRAAYAKAYRQRAEAKQRDRDRAAVRRALPGGAELNRLRVKANRAALGRNYLSELLVHGTDLTCSSIPDWLIEFKRQQMQMRRAYLELDKQIQQSKCSPADEASALK